MLRFFLQLRKFVVVRGPNCMRIQGAVWLVVSVLVIAGGGNFLAVHSKAQSMEQTRAQQQRVAYIKLSPEAGSALAQMASTSTSTRTALTTWHGEVLPGYSSTVQGVCNDRRTPMVTFVMSWSAADDGGAHHQHSNGSRPSAEVIGQLGWGICCSPAGSKT